MKKLIFITIFFLGISFNTQADNAYFINFTELLNNSKPGAQAQKKLKEKFESESKKFNKQEADIRKEEAKIISEKKALSPEDYQYLKEELKVSHFIFSPGLGDQDNPDNIDPTLRVFS